MYMCTFQAQRRAQIRKSIARGSLSFPDDLLTDDEEEKARKQRYSPWS